MDHLRIFGSVAYAHVAKALRKKLDPKSIKTVFVEYCTETKGYRLWDSKRRRIIVSRDVIFDELATPNQPTPEVFSGIFTSQSTDVLLDARHCRLDKRSAPTNVNEILAHVSPAADFPTSDDLSAAQPRRLLIYTLTCMSNQM
jgi:hypothetical protein